MQLISLLIQPFKREHNFLSWKYAWQSGQTNFFSTVYLSKQDNDVYTKQKGIIKSSQA